MPYDDENKYVARRCIYEETDRNLMSFLTIFFWSKLIFREKKKPKILLQKLFLKMLVSLNKDITN